MLGRKPDLTEGLPVFLTGRCREAVLLFVAEKGRDSFTVQGITLSRSGLESRRVSTRS